MSADLLKATQVSMFVGCNKCYLLVLRYLVHDNCINYSNTTKITHYLINSVLFWLY